jgi:N utilization substance protein B
MQEKPNMIGRKRRSRIAVIQILSQHSFYEGAESQNAIMADIISFYKEQKGSVKKKLDEEMIRTLSIFAVEKQQEAEEVIAKYLNAPWTIEKLSPILRAILKTAYAEILLNKGAGTKIILNEYIDITKMFETSKEAGFVNSILDKIIKNMVKE